MSSSQACTVWPEQLEGHDKWPCHCVVNQFCPDITYAWRLRGGPSLSITIIIIFPRPFLSFSLSLLLEKETNPDGEIGTIQTMINAQYLFVLLGTWKGIQDYMMTSSFYFSRFYHFGWLWETFFGCGPLIKLTNLLGLIRDEALIII